MAIFKRGRTYWYEFQFKNKRLQESTGLTNPRAARQVEAARKTQLAKDEVGIKERKPAPTLEDFSKRFLKWVEVDRADKPRTVLFYKTRIRLLLKFEPFKTASMDDIHEELIAQFTTWRKNCSRTKVTRRGKGLVEYGKTKNPVSVAGINRELAVLRRVLRIAKEWRVIQSVPVIHTLPGEKVSERILDHEEEDCYLAAASPLLRQFASIAIDTGFRPEEVLKMRWENVKFNPAGNAKYGYIHNPSGKSFRAKRSIPMTVRVRELLKAQHESSGRLRWG